MPPGTLNMKRIYFDIETGPLPESELLAMLPPFDASEVRVGNLKDEAKIAAKIAEAEVNHRRDFIDRAALDATTGRVIAIGLLTPTPRSPHPRPLSPADAERVAATGREQIGEVEIIGDDDEAVQDELGSGQEPRLVMTVEIPEIIRRLAGRGKAALRAVRADAEIDVEQRLRVERGVQKQQGAE